MRNVEVTGPYIHDGSIATLALQGENFVSFTSDQIGGNLSPLTVFRDQQGFTGRIVASSSSFEEIRRFRHRLPARASAG